MTTPARSFPPHSPCSGCPPWPKLRITRGEGTHVLASSLDGLPRHLVPCRPVGSNTGYPVPGQHDLRSARERRCGSPYMRTAPTSPSSSTSASISCTTGRARPTRHRLPSRPPRHMRDAIPPPPTAAARCSACPATHPSSTPADASGKTSSTPHRQDRRRRQRRPENQSRQRPAPAPETPHAGQRILRRPAHGLITAQPIQWVYLRTP